MEAFVYCWTDHKEGKLYVGSHKGGTTDGYVSSSKYLLEEYMKRREDFTRQIIATGSEEDMRKFERTLLQAIDAKNDDQFYNRSNADGIFGKRGPQSEHHKAKISEALKGNKNMVGKSRSEETKRKISESLKGRKLSVVHRDNLKGKRKGGWNHTEETKRKISATKKGDKQ
jgi:hypothetical protein